MAGACESGDEPSGFIKCWELLDQLKISWLLTKGSAVLIYVLVHLTGTNNLFIAYSTRPASSFKHIRLADMLVEFGTFCTFYGTRNSAKLYVGVASSHPRDGCLRSHGRSHFNSQ